VNAAKTGSTPERIEPQAASRRGLGLEHFVLYGHSWGGILGKSEFLVTGNLKNWERWDRLHEIKVKALTIGAQYDEMDPEDMKKMAGLMPNAGYAFCPNGSHLCMWDDQEAYFKHLLNFLHEV
jgi:pimeloyl-ACP methyl ester carboxylesterase